MSNAAGASGGDDVLIVGGGIIGLSLAYELSGHGCRVHVVDRREPGQEASWAGAGILPPVNFEHAQHPLDQLRGLSHQLHPQWAERLQEETGIDTGFRRCGGIYLARRPGDRALLAGLVGMCHTEGVTVEKVEPQRLREWEPALAPRVDDGSILAAYWMPDEAQLRNPHHLQALLNACVKRGVQISADVEVTDFEIRGGHVVRVHSRAADLSAGRVCITSGAWTRLLLERLGLATGVMPIRGQMILYRCRRRPFAAVLNEGPRYLVPRDDGRVLVGSSEEEVGFDKQTTEQVLDELKSLATSLVPALAEAKCEAAWAGLRPGSFDGFPYLGKVPGVDNLFVAAGHFRSGLHMSTGTAVVIGQLLRGLEPQIDLTPFRVGRG